MQVRDCVGQARVWGRHVCEPGMCTRQVCIPVGRCLPRQAGVPLSRQVCPPVGSCTAEEVRPPVGSCRFQGVGWAGFGAHGGLVLGHMVGWFRGTRVGCPGHAELRVVGLWCMGGSMAQGCVRVTWVGPWCMGGSVALLALKPPDRYSPHGTSALELRSI